MVSLGNPGWQLTSTDTRWAMGPVIVALGTVVIVKMGFLWELN